VILISGSGTNLQAIISAVKDDDLPIDIRAVICNRPAAGGLQIATDAGIPTIVLDHSAFASREDYDAALMAKIDAIHPQVVILAGFMRILSAGFVNHYLGKMLNIHPALLPAFPGLNTHERVLEAAVKQHGASVHFVTPEVDGGPVIIQASVAVEENDDAASLAARVLEQEHIIYPIALRWFATGRLTYTDNQAMLDGKPLQPGGIRYQHPTEHNVL
jgi:phosphoribosylglycinamide formyltransferase-1